MRVILTATACRRSRHSTVVTSDIYVKVEPQGFQHSDLSSHFLSAVKFVVAVPGKSQFCFCQWLHHIL